MKAVTFDGIGQVKLSDVPEPQIQEPTDAVIRIIASSICGTDLHMIRGTMSGMIPGTILGHEAVGIVEEVGEGVTEIKPGDRVVVASTIACGKCVYCQAQEFSSCDRANPNGPEAGSAFFGGPGTSGPFHGLQAERARIPYADTVLTKLPEAISKEDALLFSDIFPTGYMGAEIADVKPGDTVAVFGCGPVGQMAIASSILLGAKIVLAVDVIPDRLEMAAAQGAIPINYELEDPVEALKKHSNGYGPDACIDAVGVDSQQAHSGPAKNGFLSRLTSFIDQRLVAPASLMFGSQWRAGDAPYQALRWCVEGVRKSGVISIIGVYPLNAVSFPIGLAMQKALTIRAANCSHSKYIPKLLKLAEENDFHPADILTRMHVMEDAIACYKHFDKREPGWMKVELLPKNNAA
ncbi:MAG: alcohol dehydrogenase catalytic domain-containing protein [Candidatus Obscuribacterales bacterium]|nr:alcohol dehydrogenase catalytic domain-containing protein [Candidatus Obscuribacterales bacterium]